MVSKRKHPTRFWHKEARQVLPSGRPRALPSGRPSATSLLPMPFPPPAKARKNLKKTRRTCAKKNTVIDWNTTTEAIKWRRAKYEKTKHRNQQNGMNEGQAPKKTQEKKHLQQHQEKHDNDYETKKTWHQKKHKRKCKESGREKDQRKAKKALEILPKKHTQS